MGGDMGKDGGTWGEAGRDGGGDLRWMRGDLGTSWEGWRGTWEGWLGHGDLLGRMVWGPGDWTGGQGDLGTS